MPAPPPACAAARGLDLLFATVAITGTVHTTNLAPSLGVKAGTPVKMTFQTLAAGVDRIANDGSGVHLEDGIAPHLICNESFAFSVGPYSATMGPSAPVVPPALPSDDTFFSLQSKRPVNDAIFVSTLAGTPSAIPLKFKSLDAKGIEALYPSPFKLDFALDYRRAIVKSLSLKEAAKTTYGTKGLVKTTFRLSTAFATNYVLDATIDAVSISYPESR